MSLDYLKGRTALDLILEFPKISWTYFYGGHGTPGAQIDTLTFVTYESHAPVSDKVDLFGPRLKVSQELSREDLSFIEREKEKTVGLISEVKLGEFLPVAKEYAYVPPFGKFYGEHSYAHLPMIDFDTEGRFDFMTEDELIQMIKRTTAEITQIRKGVILKSSGRNYHFFGTGYLLSEIDFMTFTGLCLSMKYDGPNGQPINLVDERGIGHALTPMNLYMAAEWDEENSPPKGFELSHYIMGARFMTLRVSSKPGKNEYPKIVDIMDG